MEKLILNDGTELSGHALELDGILWMYLNATDLPTGYAYMSSPEKTRKIVAMQDGECREYAGYNHLFCIREESGGMLSAGLKADRE